MATKRAKRLEGYLNNKLGWETKSVVYHCKAPGCGFRAFYQQAYCSDCGAKMPKKPARDTEVFEQLEAALLFAVGSEG